MPKDHEQQIKDLDRQTALDMAKYMHNYYDVRRYFEQLVELQGEGKVSENMSIERREQIEAFLAGKRDVAMIGGFKTVIRELYVVYRELDARLKDREKDTDMLCKLLAEKLADQLFNIVNDALHGKPLYTQEQMDADCKKKDDEITGLKGSLKECERQFQEKVGEISGMVDLLNQGTNANKMLLDNFNHQTDQIFFIKQKLIDERTQVLFADTTHVWDIDKCRQEAKDQIEKELKEKFK
jgi:hypothetical protein